MMSANTSSSLTHLSKDLIQFVEEQGTSELKPKDPSVRLAALIRMSMHDWEGISRLISKKRISKFACTEIATRLLHALRISVNSCYFELLFYFNYFVYRRPVIIALLTGCLWLSICRNLESNL